MINKPRMSVDGSGVAVAAKKRSVRCAQLGKLEPKVRPAHIRFVFALAPKAVFEMARQSLGMMKLSIVCFWKST